MAGGFDPIDPVQCAHYAAFASHLDRRSFDFIYWFLFALVIVMLFLASWKYSGVLDKVRTLGLDPDSRQYKNRMKMCMVVCGIYAVVSVVAVVMEVYALMALQFCDGEDLMPLYWSTWTMMQVGSLIAIVGIMLAIFNSLRGSKNPPWALALGTPVLVVAGIGHAVHGAVHKRVKRVRSMSRGRRRAMSASASDSIVRLESAGGGIGGGVGGAGLPMSRELTLRADDSDERDEVATPTIAGIPAHFVGFTGSGAPILRFAEDPDRLEPEHGTVIGKGEDGHVMIAFKRAMTIVQETNADGSNTNGSGNGNENGNGNHAGWGRGRRSSNPDSRPSRSGTPGPRSPVVRIAPTPMTSSEHGSSPV
ncbi:hypothetical protein C7999DRAFT_38162 [Corynascus novoguineensis]|uniref:Uncharacterized protein n=1 Tax=Corynascus novoguineensis TaxID=1126955 RepID=A0AAN7CZD8_9PEZI|nr:hypothetical protein C7999DRAFT_38162 [Corynascus novoguineensis]